MEERYKKRKREIMITITLQCVISASIFLAMFYGSIVFIVNNAGK